MGARTTDKCIIYVLVILIVAIVDQSLTHRPNQPFGNRRPFGPLAQLNSIRKNATVAEFSLSIDFKYFNENGSVEKSYNIHSDDDYLTENCSPDQKFAIIVHGWTENCDTEWIRDLAKNLIRYRGGCIICMDYYKYSNQDYGRLVRFFEPIAQILTAKLFHLEWQGFSPNDGYMFGFSFGGQLASEAGRRFGSNKLKTIDICDMAGPGFDFRIAQPDHRLAAQNVQCIHTSLDKGTRFSSCHQNWKMGNCGITQAAAGSPPKGNHGLCPYFYNSAFNHSFYAIPKPRECASRRAASTWPKGFKMGYMETRKSQVDGELYALTTASYPYTTVENSNRILDNENVTNFVMETTTQREYEVTEIFGDATDDTSDSENEISL